jgi:hypothetical protein
MTKALEYILSKFPDNAIKITDLYNQDEDFRILSEDYLTSMETLEQSRQNATKNSEFEQDYLQVKLDLEKEIIQILERVDEH